MRFSIHWCVATCWVMTLGVLPRAFSEENSSSKDISSRFSHGVPELQPQLEPLAQSAEQDSTTESFTLTIPYGT